MKTKIPIALFIFALFFSYAPFAFAQNNPSDWNQVKSLAVGTELTVKVSKGKFVSGVLTSVSDDKLELSLKKNRAAFARNNIEKIYFAVPNSKRRGKTIGAIAGALTGGTLGGAVNKNAVYESDYNYSAAILLTIGGVFGGYFVGGLLSKKRKKGVLLYKAK